MGKIDVASHLGEHFYAEVLLNLHEGESASSIFIELADAADYRILEVYRDPTIKSIRTDILSDARGNRVKLSSTSVVNAPFFNLILKVRHGRSTHFKKFPIFLDLAKKIITEIKPLPSVNAIEQQQPAPIANAVAETSQNGSEAKVEEKVESDWARTSRYGPMVYGDTVYTVASRLRTDDRFTTKQVMVALYEKNRSKFDKENINLIRAGTYLDVPSVAEVSAITPSMATKTMVKHGKLWKELKSEPTYSAIADAQKNRYSTRVRVGKKASGVAETPMVQPVERKQKPTVETIEKKADPKVASAPETTTAIAQPTKNPAANSMPSSADKEIARYKEQSEALKKKLEAKDQEISALTERMSGTAQAASEMRIKKLELKLARMQRDLDRSEQQYLALNNEDQGSDWVVYALGAIILLLLGGIGFLMRRERTHPADEQAYEDSTEKKNEGYEELAVASIEEASAEVASNDIDIPLELPELDPIGDTTEGFEAVPDVEIPDLTDEDTAEMEAFQEETEDEVDPNVDYIAEADVYLRYGMEDEALQQLQMAIRQREGNADAHIKLVHLLKGQDNAVELATAVAAAKSVLQPEDLKRFESETSLNNDVTAIEDASPSLDDTITDLDLEPSSLPETTNENSPVETDSADSDPLLDIDSIEMPAFDQTEDPNDVSASLALGTNKEAAEDLESDSISLDIGDMELSEEPQASVDSLDTDTGELDLDGLDIPDLEGFISEPTTPNEQTVILEEQTLDKPEEIETADNQLNEFDSGELELGDLELTDIMGSAESQSDDTVMMDDVTEAFDPAILAASPYGEQPNSISEDHHATDTETPATTDAFSMDDLEMPELDNMDDASHASKLSKDDNDEATVVLNHPVHNDNTQLADLDSALDLGLEPINIVTTEDDLDDADDFTSTMRLIAGDQQKPEVDGIDISSDLMTADIDTSVNLEMADDSLDSTMQLESILSDLGSEFEEVMADTLDIDTGRSQLAEGSLDEAKRSFEKAQTNEGSKGLALLGLAEVAQRQNNADAASDLLIRAEQFLNDEESRSWFNRLNNR
ncbi:MAG: FimV/HubP family polar landmark protein [Mariprofundaceae bacterium]